MAQHWRIFILFGFALCVNGAQLPSIITPCSQRLLADDLTNCVTAQARKAQQYFAKGVPEFNLEPLDPLTLDDISAQAGTFSIKSSNVVVKGLRKIDIKEIRYDLQKLSGHTKLFGNLTFSSDYETDGMILVFPITGTGKLTVKMYDTEILIKFKLRKIPGPDGDEHIESYDLRPTSKYGNVKIHMSNILGGAAIGDSINQVLNENWRDLMAEVGPPYIKAVSAKVSDVVNQFYKKVPFNDMFAP